MSTGVVVEQFENVWRELNRLRQAVDAIKVQDRPDKVRQVLCSVNNNTATVIATVTVSGASNFIGAALVTVIGYNLLNQASHTYSLTWSGGAGATLAEIGSGSNTGTTTWSLAGSTTGGSIMLTLTVVTPQGNPMNIRTRVMVLGLADNAQVVSVT